MTVDPASVLRMHPFPLLDLSWQEDGACAHHANGLVTEDFFFEEHFNFGTPEYRAAKAKVENACDGCPVRQKCLDFAIDNNQEGFWGGLTLHGRARYRRRRKAMREAETGG